MGMSQGVGPHPNGRERIHPSLLRQRLTFALVVMKRGEKVFSLS